MWKILVPIVSVLVLACAAHAQDQPPLAGGEYTPRQFLESGGGFRSPDGSVISSSTGIMLMVPQDRLDEIARLLEGGQDKFGRCRKVCVVGASGQKVCFPVCSEGQIESPFGDQ